MTLNVYKILLFKTMHFNSYSDKNREMKLPPLVPKIDEKNKPARRIFHRNNPHPRINFPFPTGDRVRIFYFIFVYKSELMIRNSFTSKLGKQESPISTGNGRFSALCSVHRSLLKDKQRE